MFCLLSLVLIMLAWQSPTTTVDSALLQQLHFSHMQQQQVPTSASPPNRGQRWRRNKDTNTTQQTSKPKTATSTGPPTDAVLQERWSRARTGATTGKFQKIEKLCPVCFLGNWSSKEHCRSCHGPLTRAYTVLPGQWPPFGGATTCFAEVGLRFFPDCFGSQCWKCCDPPFCSICCLPCPSHHSFLYRHSGYYPA